MPNCLNNIAKILICPDDQAKLITSGHSLFCEYCRREFPVTNGVFRMLPIEYSSNSESIKERKQSMNYWDGGIPGTVEKGYQEGKVTSSYGTKEWYLEGDIFRYNNYKSLNDYCEFDEYKGKRVLDIGPGRGQEVHNYVMAGAKVTVLEFANQGVELVANRRNVFEYDIDIIQGDAAQLPIKDNYFDLVFSYGVLHHIPAIELAINEVSRVLRRGGRAKIMLYHKGYFYYEAMLLKWYILKGNFLKYRWKDYIKIAMEQREGPCPVVNIYSMKEILSLLENSNLEVVDYFNAEIIEGRLIRWGIIPKWFVERFKNQFGAFCHLTLTKQ